MRQREILALAKKNYPIGTEIIPFNLDLMMGDPKSTTIDLKNYHFAHYSDYSIKKPDAIWVHTGHWTSVIYDRGKWAKIIKK